MKQSLSPFFQVWWVGYELQALELAMVGQWSVVAIEGSVGALQRYAQANVPILTLLLVQQRRWLYMPR